jgi:hypothetical protein
MGAIVSGVMPIMVVLSVMVVYMRCVMLISRYPNDIELPTKSDRRTAMRTQM